MTSSRKTQIKECVNTNATTMIRIFVIEVNLLLQKLLAEQHLATRLLIVVVDWPLSVVASLDSYILMHGNLNNRLAQVS